MKKMTYSALIIVFLILGDVFHNKANAQYGTPFYPYQAAYNNAMFLTTKNAIEKGMHSSSSGTASKSNTRATETNAAGLADLNFTSSAQTHEKVVQAIAKTLARGDDSKINPNTDMLVKGDLLGKFDNLLRQYGFDSHNLADVFTAYIILSWQAATGGDASKYPNGIQVFRKTIHASFSNNDNTRNFTNEQKQETSETISYIATLITLGHQDLKRKGDANVLLQFHQNIRNTVMASTGIDVTKYTLTQAGFYLK